METENSTLDANVATAATPTVVEVQSLVKTYKLRSRSGKRAPVRPAVDGVTLKIKRGELLVLLGPSGCGKTTLLRSIAGLELPDEGQVSIAGETVFSSKSKTDMPPEARGIGMMFQTYALWPHMTVYENVRYPLSLRKDFPSAEHRDRVLATLQRLGVAEYEQRHPGQLSGGQQQRVALARALVASPPVILFDEPLSNVDARVRKVLRRYIRQLKAESQFAGIYVTHDQEEAMELADTLAIMSEGKILQIGAPRYIYENPCSLAVADFIGEVNRLRGVIAHSDGETFSVNTAIGSVSIDKQHTACKVNVGDEGTVIVRPEDVLIVSCGAGNGECFAGVSSGIAFVGSKSELLADIGGESITVWTSEKEAKLPAAGSPVMITFRKRAARWLIS